MKDNLEVDFSLAFIFQVHAQQYAGRYVCVGVVLAMFDDFEQDLLGCQRVGKSRRPSNTFCMQCEWRMYFVVSRSDKT